MNKGLYLIEVGESEKCKLSISGFDMASVQYRWWVTVGNAFVVGSGPVVDVRGKTPGFSAVYVQVSDIHRTVVVSADMAVYSVDLAVNGNSVGSGHTYFMTRDHNPAKPVAYVPNLEAKIQSGGALALVGSLKPAVWTFKAIGRSKGVLPSSLHFLQGFQSGNNKVLRTPWSTQKGVDRTAISRVCMPPHGFNEGMVTFDTGFGWRRSFFVLVPGVVVLDPGHGLSGSDICPVGQIKGCSSPNNAYSSRKWPDRRTGKKVLERDMTWDMARRIKDKLLELRPDLQVVLTRGQGEALSGVNTREKIARERRNNPSGWDRARHAQNARADVFLSVHFNGNDDPTLRGVEVYFRDTHDVHHRPRVRDWNRGTARNPNPAQDIRLGQGILNAVDTALKTFDSVSYMRTVRPDTMSFKKALAPLNEEARGYGNTMPFHPVRGVLCEIEYISHPKVDELFNGVRQNEVRNRVAEKVASAIIQDIKNQP
jgi:N-acetylmuramoyl-L-alanine amidase